VRRRARLPAGTLALTAAAAMLAGSPVAAQDAAPPQSEAAAEAAAERVRPPNRLSVKARVELQGKREEKAGRAAEESFGADTARVELRYERGQWLDAVFEVDAADGVEVLDAFVRLGTRALRTQVGQFKPPISATELESSWTLPLVRRGVVHKTVEDYMRFAGRRPGVQVEASAEGPLRPALALGAFQGLAPGGDPMDTVGVYETTFAGRASIRPGPLELGAFGALAGTEPIAGFGIGRYWTAGADAVLDLEVGPFGVRAWADAFYGKSFYAVGLIGFDGTFAAGRAITALRWGGLRGGRPYVEVFGLAETVRFDLETPGSTLTGMAAGVNVGLWRRLRLGLQVEERRSGSASPPLTERGNQLRDRRVYAVELGGSLGHGWRF
jgi:hypothetical protein